MELCAEMTKGTVTVNVEKMFMHTVNVTHVDLNLRLWSNQAKFVWAVVDHIYVNMKTLPGLYIFQETNCREGLITWTWPEISEYHQSLSSLTSVTSACHLIWFQNIITYGSLLNDTMTPPCVKHTVPSVFPFCTTFITFLKLDPGHSVLYVSDRLCVLWGCCVTHSSLSTYTIISQILYGNAETTRLITAFICDVCSAFHHVSDISLFSGLLHLPLVPFPVHAIRSSWLDVLINSF